MDLWRQEPWIINSRRDLKKMKNLALYILILPLGFSCQSLEKNRHLINDISPNLENQWVNMIVEIPTGTNEKWEVNKTSGFIERDSINGEPRTIQYLSYPGNYGFIPQTLLSKKEGGDGDPLDILVIGEAVERGSDPHGLEQWSCVRLAAKSNPQMIQNF